MGQHLTITSDEKPHKIGVVFPQQVGDQMHLVVDDVLRFLRLSYPNWNVAHAELTFADKYNPHDGGSIGAAVGTLILSTIRGFEIDPKTAITGDVSADGKVRMIGGVAAKLRGAAAAGGSLPSLQSKRWAVPTLPACLAKFACRDDNSPSTRLAGYFISSVAGAP